MAVYQCPRCKSSIDYEHLLRAFKNLIGDHFICVSFEMKCPLCENWITVEPILHPDFKLHAYEPDGVTLARFVGEPE